jgi:hypothetical protein
MKKPQRKKMETTCFDTNTDTLTLRQIEVNQSAACAVLVTPYAKNPSLKLHCLSFIAAAGSSFSSWNGMLFSAKKARLLNCFTSSGDAVGKLV